MNKLMRMIEACARSDARIRRLENDFNYGRLNTGECIDKIIEETARIKEELMLIRIGKKQFIKDRELESLEVN